MPIYQIAQYQVKPSAIEKVKRAIEEFVRYVQANESGTRMYQAWQQEEDPTRFAHFFIFPKPFTASQTPSNASSLSTHRNW